MTILKTHQYSWSLNYPSVKAKNWFDLSSFNTKNDNGIFLNFAPHTFEVLDFALDNNLSRFDGWIFSDKSQYFDSCVDAAKIYKRGVSTTQSEHQSASGVYKINFHSNLDLISYALKNDFFIIIDQNFHSLWQEKLNIKYDANLCIIDPSEQHKDIHTCQTIYETWTTKKSMNWLIIGGGITCDIGAFCASICSAKFDFVPTTLLAMIDASIGGKTGVNFRGFKNQIGSFAFPSQIHIYTEFLKTLSDEEYHNGFVEGFKHCLLTKDRNFTLDIIEKYQKRNLLAEDLLCIIDVKARIVEQDSGENKLRMSLNLGHTVGHILEQICIKNHISPALKHGQAVLIGTIFSFYLSNNLNILSTVELQEFINISKKIFNYFTFKNFSLLKNKMGGDVIFSEFYTQLKYDKKRSSGYPTWILLKNWSDVEYVSTDIPSQILKKSWDQMLDFLRNNQSKNI